MSPGELPAIVECAARAADVLARTEVSHRDVARRRNQLVRVLLRGPDLAAATELIRVERLRADASVHVDAGGRRGGWPPTGGLRAYVAGDRPPVRICSSHFGSTPTGAPTSDLRPS